MPPPPPLSKPHIDDSCPRFLNIKITGPVGLGHKATEVIFGMICAEVANATYVLDNRRFQGGSKNHGADSYLWFIKDFIPLTETEFTFTDLMGLRQRTKAQLESVNAGYETLKNETFQREHPCNVMFNTALHWCGLPGEYCHLLIKGIYDKMKWRMRQAFSRSRFRPQQSLDVLVPPAPAAPASPAAAPVPNNNQTSTIIAAPINPLPINPLPPPPPITIAWHLRNGDVVLNGSKNYFVRVSTQLAAIFKQAGISAHVFFFRNHEKDFEFLPELCQTFFQGRCSFPIMDEQETLYRFTESDILITSGSSFAYLGALFREEGIVLNALAKEGVIGHYELPEHGFIAKDGTIKKPSLPELMHQLRSVYDRKLNRHLNNRDFSPTRTS